MQHIILASQSPRRKQLLEWAEVPFEVITAGTDESYPAGLTPQEVAVFIAKEKALAVREKIRQNFHHQHLGKPILAADTIVVIDEKIIGKPQDREEAITILQQLSGRKHKVITGVIILHNEAEIVFADTTEVSFHSLTTEQLSYYVDQYQPYDKAGAYAIQEWIGVVGIESINGDFYNVMGLPVSRVYQTLQQLAK